MHVDHGRQRPTLTADQRKPSSRSEIQKTTRAAATKQGFGCFWCTFRVNWGSSVIMCVYPFSPRQRLPAVMGGNRTHVSFVDRRQASVPPKTVRTTKPQAGTTRKYWQTCALPPPVLLLLLLLPRPSFLSFIHLHLPFAMPLLRPLPRRKKKEAALGTNHCHSSFFWVSQASCMNKLPSLFT